MVMKVHGFVPKAERHAQLRKALEVVPYFTVTTAWNFGYERGFYEGGDASVTKDDLNAVAICHKGFAQGNKESPTWGRYWTLRPYISVNE
jgi:hypothetical protein